MRQSTATSLLLIIGITGTLPNAALAGRCERDCDRDYRACVRSMEDREDSKPARNSGLLPYTGNDKVDRQIGVHNYNSQQNADNMRQLGRQLGKAFDVDTAEGANDCRKDKADCLSDCEGSDEEE
jgi:hypothetical protein